MAKPKVAVLIRGRAFDELFRPRAEKLLGRFAEPIYSSAEGPWRPEEAREMLAEAEGCITSWGSPKVGPDEIAAAPNLRIIAHGAGSIRPYVAPEAFDRGIVVTSAASVISPYVAEFALAMAVALLRRVHMHDRAMKVDRTHGDKAQKDSSTIFRCRVGLVGLGRVGQDFARMLRPFGAEVLAYDPHVDPKVAAWLRVRLTDLDEVLSTCEVVSLHAAKIPQTNNIIGREELKKLRDGAVLVNTARGSIVDHEALVEELRTGRIHAALDVTEPEPLPPDSPLRALPNVILTPHIAGPPANRRWELAVSAVQEIRRFFSGRQPRNVVTKEMLEWMA